ncbi:type 2 periplasmic-binding domain-containing protein [Pseudidiomarina andamanensis]|nr:hypothetical protein [Pseudidiomarina andamanensis]MDS0217528.1 hypothetical protein [Pseudidiomarina andamanensis]
MTRRFWVISLSIFMVFGCQPQHEPINVVGNSWLGYQPIYAQYKLHPEQQPPGIHITMLVSDISVVRMLTNQAASVAMLSLDNAISLNSRTNLDLCIALVMSSSDGADAVLASPNFLPMLSKDLPIRVGMEDSALARYVVSRWIEKKAIDETRLQRHILLPPGHSSALKNDDVDVIATYAPFTQTLKEQGAEVIFSSQEIPDEIIDTIVIRQDVWLTHKERLQAFITDSWDTALSEAQTPNSDVFKAMMKLSNLSENELSQTMAQLKFYDSQRSREFLATRYAEVSNIVSNHLAEAGLFTAPRSLPICDGVLQ